MTPLKDPELRILQLLKENNKLRWEDLVKKSGLSRRWVHLNVVKLVERGLVEKNRVERSDEYPSPVYYSISKLPKDVEAELEAFKTANEYARAQEIAEAISVGIRSTERSLEEFSLLFKDVSKLVEIIDESAKWLEEIKPLINDIEGAVKAGDIPKEILNAPADEAVKMFLAFKVERGEMSPEILDLPLKEAIQKYCSEKRLNA